MSFDGLSTLSLLSLLDLDVSSFSIWAVMSTNDNKSFNLVDMSSCRSEASLAILVHNSLKDVEAGASAGFAEGTDLLTTTESILSP